MATAPRFKFVKESFQQTLKARVEQYFAEHKLCPYGNRKLYIKTALIAISFVVTYTWLIFFTPGIWVSIALCVWMGLNIAAVGFNIMHDGAHGSYSPKPWVNRMAAYSLDFMGASSFMWRVKHNIAHHTYTNIHGWDDDLNIRPMLRLARQQKRYFFHRFQHLYFLPLYSFLYIFWVGFTDYRKYFSGLVGQVGITRMTWRDQLIFWGSKLQHIALFIAIPIWQVGLVNYLFGFLIFSSTVGIFISMVFQLAHSVEEVEFPVPADENRIDEEWAIHQLRTTANFATRNKVLTWFAGGLNYQIEHHLFPKVSHVHYPAISRIVKQTSAEFNLPYVEFRNISTAVVAHIRLLKEMGTAV